MSDISHLLENLSLEDNKNIIFISKNEIEILNIKNNNLVQEFYYHLDCFKKIFNKCTILSNKELVIWLIKFTWLYDKIVESILRVSINYWQDLSANGLDKINPSYFFDIIKNNLSNEQYLVIKLNYDHYLNLFTKNKI